MIKYSMKHYGGERTAVEGNRARLITKSCLAIKDSQDVD